MFLVNLKCKEFNYNYEFKSIAPSLEVDGIEPSPVIWVDFQECREEEGEKV